MTTILRRVVVALLAAGIGVAVSAQQTRKLAVPQPAVDAIIDAFRTHPLVCLGEGGHRGVQDLELRLAILRDPRFSAIVNDVVVEMGNARYQSLMDRFVAGADVPDAELREVWENATPPDTVADSPVYEALYRGVRAINANLHRDRQLRVLLGDPPIDWNVVHSPADVLRWDDARDPHAAEVIRREVLAKGRRGIIMYGQWHCSRRNEHTNFTTADSLLAMLEQGRPGSVYAVRTWGREHVDLRTLQADVARWSPPVLAALSGTTLGAVDVATISPPDPRVEYRDGVRTPIPRSEWRVRPLEQQFDAIIYMGPPSTLTIARLDPSKCRDERYMTMRTQRMALTLGIIPDGSTPDTAIAQLRQYCAAFTQP